MKTCVTVGVGIVLAACTPPVSPCSSSRSRVEYRHHHSQALGVDKTYLVYIPAAYDDAPTMRWPVFYYLHGLTSPETEWVQLGKLDEAADAMHLDAIVVMPDADDGWYIDSPTPIDFDACMKTGAGLYDPDARDACVHQRAYESYIAAELVAHIDATYRTIASRDGRAIAGVSMGGYGALSLGLRHADRYAAIVSHSGALTLLYDGPHPFAPGQVRVASELDRATGVPPRIRQWTSILFGTDIARWREHDPAVLVEAMPAPAPAIYLDCGTEDFLIDTTRFVDELLTTHHVDHAIFYGPGIHDYAFWTPRLPASLAFLRDHTSKPRRL